METNIVIAAVSVIAGAALDHFVFPVISKFVQNEVNNTKDHMIKILDHSKVAAAVAEQHVLSEAAKAAESASQNIVKAT